MVDYFRANVAVGDSEIAEIEEVTQGQSTNNLWMAERHKHITASNVRAVANRRNTTKVAKLVKTLQHLSWEPCNNVRP